MLRSGAIPAAAYLFIIWICVEYFKAGGFTDSETAVVLVEADV
jgi:hypothetical protein